VANEPSNAYAIKLNATGTGVLEFDFADAGDTVTLEAGSKTSGFTTLKVTDGTLDATNADLTGITRVEVASGITVSLEQIRSIPTIVANSATSEITVEVNSEAEATELVALITAGTVTVYGDTNPIKLVAAPTATVATETLTAKQTETTASVKATAEAPADTAVVDTTTTTTTTGGGGGTVAKNFSSVMSGNTLSFDGNTTGDISVVANTTSRVVDATQDSVKSLSQPFYADVTGISVVSGQKVVMTAADYATIGASITGAGDVSITNVTTSSDLQNVNVTGTITVAGESSAANLTELDGATTVKVVATGVTNIVGTAADSADALNDQTTLDTAADVTVTTSGTSATLAHLKTIEAATSGLVTATANTSVSGSLADAKLLLVTNEGTSGDKINMAAAAAVSIDDATGTLQAADLKAVGGATTGAVTLASAQTVSGTVADVTAALITSGTSVGVKASAANTATVTDAATAAEAAAIAGITDVTYNGSGGITDSSTNLLATTRTNLKAAAADDSDVAVTINDAATASLTAANLALIADETSGTVTVTNAAAVGGTVSELTDALITDAVTFGAASTAAASDAATAAEAKAIAAVSNITASFDGGITDTVALMSSSGTLTANMSAAVTEDTDVAVTTSGTSGDLADLKAIDSGTTGFVNAASVTSTTGSLADAKLILSTNDGTTGNTIAHKADLAVSINDATGTLAAGDLKLVGLSTTGAVSLVYDQTISGLAADVNDALVTSGSKVVVKSGGSGSTATVTDAATAAVAGAIAGVTDVTGNFAGGISDTVANLVNSDSTAVSTGLGAADGDDADVNITIITTTTATAAQVELIETATTGTLNTGTLATITVVSGGSADLKHTTVSGKTLAFDEVDDTGSGEETVTISGTSVDDTINLSSVTIDGADIIKLIVNGADGNDTITGGAGVDHITGGGGNDSITVGTGADIIKTSDNHSTDSTAHDLNTTSDAIAAGETITFGDGVDVITDFVKGTDKLDIDSITDATAAPTTLINVDHTSALSDNVAYVGYGTWDGSSGVFTFAAAFDATSAKDALVVTDGAAETIDVNDAIVILDDLTAALTGADIM